MGGMGPEATADLMQRIIRLTSAKCDQDHIRCFIDNNPKVPNRYKAIVEGSIESAGPHVVAMAKQLESWGSDFLAMPCNSAHYYLLEIQAAVKIPVLDMMSIALDSVSRHFEKQRLEGQQSEKQSPRLVGLLGTPVLRFARLYEEKAWARGLEIIYPVEADGQKIFDLINAVKAGENSCSRKEEEMSKTLWQVALNMADQGVEAVVLACTELGLIPLEAPLRYTLGTSLRDTMETSETSLRNSLLLSRLPVFDAAEELAREIVRFAKSDD